MALIKCSECGKEISEKAKTCIHCGNPIFKEKVKSMNKKKWEDLTDIEKRKIGSYRQTIHKWWIGERVMGIIFGIIGIILVWAHLFFNIGFVFFFIGIFFLGILILSAFIISPKEQKRWYEEHIDEVYENEILK